MRRRGLTLVEVTVIVFVLVILIGLMIPAVSRVGDSSARTQTNCNLKQCALAVHNYHDTYRKLPDGFDRGGIGGIYEAKEVSLWIHLLPYVESDNVYKNGLPNEVVPSYIAPSDPFNIDNAGIVNFAANVRVFGHETLGPEKANEPGVAVDVPEGTLKSGLTLPRIVDGTTNVIMLTTRYSHCAGQTTWYATDARGKSQSVRPFPPTPGVGGFMGAGSHNTPPAGNNAPVTAMFQIVPTVNGCVPQAGLFGHSFSTGGMSVALCDASVKNITPTMSPTTFSRALCPGDKQERGAGWNAD